MLDFDVSTQAGFMAFIFHLLIKTLKSPFSSVYAEGELATLDTFSHLRHIFDAWLVDNGFISLWLYWVNRCYPKSALKQLEFF